MEFLKKKTIWFVILLPILLANKDCERQVTWGDKQVPEWVSQHAQVTKDTSCADCHEDGRTRATKPQTHDASWTTQHGKLLQQQYGFTVGNTCYMCHRQADCSSCHTRDKPKSHTQYFRLKGHGVTSALNRDACMTCHDTSICERCHMQTKPRSHTAAWGGTQNLHCNNCHQPLSATGTGVEQSCEACHKSNTSHTAQATPQPNTAQHLPGATCRSCHAPVTQHPDNGQNCEDCHQ